MTQDEIQEAARFAYVRGGTSESLFHIMWNSQPSASIGWSREELIAFANAVAAKEREACAKLCDVLAVHPEYVSEITKLAAQAIRNRG